MPNPRTNFDAPPTSRTRHARVLAATVIALAAVVAGLAMWAATPPQQLPQRHTVVSATPGEAHFQCRGSTCVRPVTHVELTADDGGVTMLREVDASPHVKLSPGQEVPVYRDPLGNITLSKGTAFRTLNATVATLLAGMVTGGALAVVARRRRKRAHD